MSDITRRKNELQEAKEEFKQAKVLKTSAPDLYAYLEELWEAAKAALDEALEDMSDDPEPTAWVELDDDDDDDSEDYDENNSNLIQAPKTPTPEPSSSLVSGEGGKVELGKDKGDDKKNDEEPSYGPKNPFKIGDLTRDAVPSYLKATRSEYYAFKKKVYKKCVKTASDRRPFAMGIASDDEGTVQERTVHKDIVKDATDLIEAAETAIAAAKAADDKTAKKARKKVGLASTYRTAPQQFKLWNSRFTATYMERHHEELLELDGGELSSKWVRIFARKISGATATPGYSLHQLGISLDFSPPEKGVENKKPAKHQKKWKKTWFHSWLEDNAETYGFEAYSGEAWHWNYTKLMP